jgi:uncharacterized protein YkwD
VPGTHVLFLAALVSFALVPCATPATDDGAGDPAATLVDLTNAARASARVPVLRANSRLMQAAQLHARQMARLGRLDHVLPRADYPRPEDRLKKARYAWQAWAENVALGQRDPDQVVRSWMKSRPHRANILNREVTEIGVGYARDAKGQVYWVQLFARPVPGPT